MRYNILQSIESSSCKLRLLVKGIVLVWRTMPERPSPQWHCSPWHGDGYFAILKPFSSTSLLQWCSFSWFNATLAPCSSNYMKLLGTNSVFAPLQCFRDKNDLCLEVLGGLSLNNPAGHYAKYRIRVASRASLCSLSGGASSSGPVRHLLHKQHRKSSKKRKIFLRSDSRWQTFQAENSWLVCCFSCETEGETKESIQIPCTNAITCLFPWT